jgi:hypothetical protein
LRCHCPCGLRSGAKCPVSHIASPLRSVWMGVESHYAPRRSGAWIEIRAPAYVAKSEALLSACALCTDEPCSTESRCAVSFRTRIIPRGTKLEIRLIKHEVVPNRGSYEVRSSDGHSEFSNRRCARDCRMTSPVPHRAAAYFAGWPSQSGDAVRRRRLQR